MDGRVPSSIRRWWLPPLATAAGVIVAAACAALTWLVTEMSGLVTGLHPVTLLALVAATVVVAAARVRRWPGWWIAITWVVIPALLNPVLWHYGAPVLGWRMGGLSGTLCLWLTLPPSGLFLGVAAVPVMTALLGRERRGLRLLLPGLALEALVLIAWLAIASQLHAYVSDLGA